ncbi:MAG: hypothetical protein ACOC1P_01405 [Minisyncoccales bacterium]
MEIEIYSGNIENAGKENPYSPKGFIRFMSELELIEGYSTKCESENEIYFYPFSERVIYKNKKKIKDVEIDYLFKGKRDSGKFSGLVRFVLNSDNPEKISEIENSIKKCLKDKKSFNSQFC